MTKITLEALNKSPELAVEAFKLGELKNAINELVGFEVPGLKVYFEGGEKPMIKVDSSDLSSSKYIGLFSLALTSCKLSCSNLYGYVKENSDGALGAWVTVILSYRSYEYDRSNQEIGDFFFDNGKWSLNWPKKNHRG